MSSADYDVAYCDACERCHLNGICPLTNKAQKVVSMTDAGWAERQVRTYLDRRISKVSDVILAEHARSVRIVKRLKKQAHLDEFSMSADQLDAYVEALNDVLTALQRGRGGKG